MAPPFQAVARNEQLARNRFLPGPHGEVLQRQPFGTSEQLGRPVDLPTAIGRLPWSNLDSVRGENGRPCSIRPGFRPGSAAESEDQGVGLERESSIRRLKIGAPAIQFPRQIYEARGGSELDGA